jgi:hypothetical protein
MRRACTKCGRPFEPGDLVKDRSRQMEADRRAAGLDGVRFVTYRCPCGAEDVFIDVLPKDDELAEDFDRRTAAMEEAARRVRADGVEAQVVPVAPRDRA